MSIQEGRWDCDSCGTTGLRGRDMSCPNCGARRPEGVKFYLADDSEYVTDETRLEEARAGADWVCEWCGASNRAGLLETCSQCGAERGTSPSQQVKEYSLEEAPDSGDNTIERRPPPPDPREQKSAPPLWKNPLVLGAVAVVLLACIGVAFLLMPREVEATVSGVSWERTIDVEQYQTVTETDWDVPTDGRVVEEWEEVHHVEQVLVRYETKTREVTEQVKVGTEEYVCGKRDLGNGYFEDKYCTRDKYESRTTTETYEEPVYRDDPVYETKYRYEVDKWETERIETAAGKDYNPVWPEVNLKEGEGIGAEREGQRSETYLVHFTQKDKNKTYDVAMEEDVWKTYQPGQTHKLKVSGDEAEVLE